MALMSAPLSSFKHEVVSDAEDCNDKVCQCWSLMVGGEMVTRGLG